MTISGRVQEQEVLQGLLESKHPEFLAVYGRRRVGKTFLIREFFQDRAAFLEVTGRFGGTLRQHMQIFAEALVDTFDIGVDMTPPRTWHDAFRTLQTLIEKAPRRKKKLVLFFDELPWLATRRSGCLEELELFWNRWCSRRPDVILVICGSAASWMLRKIVHARGGLHNRLTRTIRLLPLDLFEARVFLRDRGISMTRREVTELYMALGGIPYYLQLVERGRSVSQNLDRLCFQPGGPLVDEFSRLFASLFQNDRSHVKVVQSLARNRLGMPRAELLSTAGLSSGGGARTILKNLEEGGFIAATVPFGRISRDQFFRLTDEFSLFHLKWMRRHQPSPGPCWQQKAGTPSWRAWSGLAFERVCLKHAGAIKGALGISGVQTSESSWLHQARTAGDHGAQIDLLIDRADGVISLCELKFSQLSFTITKRYAEQLRHKVQVFREQTRTRKATHLVFITSCGLKQNRYATELVDRALTMEALFM